MVQVCFRLVLVVVSILIQYFHRLSFIGHRPRHIATALPRYLENDLYFGNKTSAEARFLTLEYSMEHCIVTNWEVFFLFGTINHLN
jgi:hypothetical protein